MRRFWIVFVVVLVVVGAGLGFLWGAVTSLTREPDLAGGVLVWHAEGELPEDHDTSFVGRLRDGRQPTLTQVVLGLRRAAADPDVTALVLDLGGLSVSWAKLEELRQAVAAFQASGKPVWACLEDADAGDYALAVVADRVALAPEGNLAVLGVAAELAFIKDTLAKVGIAAEFVSVGKYKSAPEQYTRSEASDANREMVEAIVEDRYETMIRLLATGRRVAPEVARGWIDIGLFDPPTALASGLVDTLVSVEDVLETTFADEDVTDFGDYALVKPRGGGNLPAVALIYACGTIMPGESTGSQFQGRVLGSDTLVEQLKDAREDDEIKAVILRIDSPGGSVVASDLIWQEVKRVAAAKPLVASMSSYAASGGYYIASAADSIFADSGTLTGSIGVFAGKLDWSGLYTKIGVNREFVTRGENALLFSDATGFTDKQRELFQSQLDRFYERFLAKVATGRGMSRDSVHEVAQGRVWTGRQARERGLVDGLGGLERAIAASKLMIGRETSEPVRLRTYEKELTWLQQWLLQSFEDASLKALPTGGLPGTMTDAARLLGRTGFLAALPLLDGRPLAMAPYRIVFE